MRDLDDTALERRLREVLRDHLEALPLDLTAEALDHRRATRHGGRRLGRGRGLTLLAAAALLLVGGALAGSGLLRQPSVVPPLPAPSVAVLGSASPDATTTPVPSATASPSPTALSLDLTWTQLPIIESSINKFDADATRLAWLGDRFVLVDVKSGSVRTSTDGQDWQSLPPGDAARDYVDLLRGSFASWQDGAVGWWNPQVHGGGDVAGAPPVTARDNLQIWRPPAAPTSTTPFKGRIAAIGIGPKGIVAQVHSDLDWDAWVTKKLGLRTNNDWTCCVKDVTFQDGVLQIKLRNRPGLKVVWADEGLEPGDYQDRGFAWYSPDGEHWTAMSADDHPTWAPDSALPTGTLGSVVGVSDGFIATGSYPDDACADPNGSCVGMWFSSDGLTWRFLGTGNALGPSGNELCIRDACDALPRQLVPWRAGALAIDGDGQTTFWTSSGPTDLPLTARVRGDVARGPLGLVSMRDREVLVSRDGIDYRVSSLPADMADLANGGGGSTTMAVGDQSVLVLRKARTGEFTMTQSLWLGTFKP